MGWIWVLIASVPGLCFLLLSGITQDSDSSDKNEIHCGQLFLHEESCLAFKFQKLYNAQTNVTFALKEPGHNDNS